MPESFSKSLMEYTATVLLFLIVKHSIEKKVYFIEILFISKLDINFITNK